MEELKKFTGQSMNLDKNDKSLLPTETREVYNSITDRKGVFTRIEGNTLVNFTLPAGDNKVIGWCNDYSRHAILYFVKNSLGNHCILRVRGNKIDKVLWVQSVLNFKGRINHANTIGDLLYWTDGFSESSTSYNPPRKINMIRAIGSNNPFSHSGLVYEKFDVVNNDGKVYEFIGDTPGVFPLSDTDNWQLKGRVYDNLTSERLYWILDRIKYPNYGQAPEVYYSDNIPSEPPPIIIDPPTTIPYGFLYNWDALFDVIPITEIGYGLLYNWYVISNSSSITSSNDWAIPTINDYYTMLDYIDDLDGSLIYPIAGGKLKEIGLDHWDTPNTGADNQYMFNGRAAGLRLSGGSFSAINSYCILLTSTFFDSARHRCIIIANNSASISSQNIYDNPYGASLRLVKVSTSLSSGQTGTYTGNDGKVYRTICIGTQEWLADNLAETLYRDLSTIPEVTNNATWAALSTGALCAYNNDWGNV